MGFGFRRKGEWFRVSGFGVARAWRARESLCEKVVLPEAVGPG